jgi:hypothetical protein
MASAARDRAGTETSWQVAPAEPGPEICKRIANVYNEATMAAARWPNNRIHCTSAAWTDKLTAARYICVPDSVANGASTGITATTASSNPTVRNIAADRLTTTTADVNQEVPCELLTTMMVTSQQPLS